MKTYHLFISNSWSYSDAYDKFINLLNQRSYFAYKNYSVPQDDPIHTNGTNKQLKEKINEKIKRCHVILILAGVYATYSKWIDIEIELTKGLQKPIIAVEPWGSERTSLYVKDSADKIVKWNAESIVTAIREVA